VNIEKLSAERASAWGVLDGFGQVRAEVTLDGIEANDLCSSMDSELRRAVERELAPFGYADLQMLRHALAIAAIGNRAPDDVRGWCRLSERIDGMLAAEEADAA
jgi:hypothetical protein